MSAPSLMVDGRNAWLEERRGYLGGTDLAAIVGKSKWKTPLDVYLEKVGEKKDDAAGRKAEAGLALEPLIRRWYSDEIGREVEPGRTIRDKEHPFLGVNTDGSIEDGRILIEIKSVDFSTREEWGQPGTDEVPDAYYLQCVWQAGITGAEKVAVVRCDRGTLQMDEYVIEADPGNYELLRAAGIRFWLDHVQAKVPPDPTERDGENVIRLFPTSTGEILVSSETEDGLASRMAEVFPRYKALEKEYEQLKSAMKVAIGPAGGIQTLTGKFGLSRMEGQVSWKKVATILGAKAMDLGLERSYIELTMRDCRGEPYSVLQTPF